MTGTLLARRSRLWAVCSVAPASRGSSPSPLLQRRGSNGAHAEHDHPPLLKCGERRWRWLAPGGGVRRFHSSTYQLPVPGPDCRLLYPSPAGRSGVKKEADPPYDTVVLKLGAGSSTLTAPPGNLDGSATLFKFMPFLDTSWKICILPIPIQERTRTRTRPWCARGESSLDSGGAAIFWVR